MTNTLKTPKGNPLNPPSKALMAALLSEESTKKGQLPPLRKLAFTAEDVVGADPDTIVEVMIAYLDTDALCYYAENPDLYARQQAKLQPVLDALNTRFDVHIKTTQGLMPLAQGEELETRMRSYLQALEPYALTALLALTQIAGSALLAVAVHEKIVAEPQFLSIAWIEEDFQRERNGVDEEAAAKREETVANARAALHFLRLLQAA